MKKISLIFSFFLSLQTFAQLSIDSLKTEADIENFVLGYGKMNGMWWEKVSLSPHHLNWEERRYSANIKNLDSLVNRRWITVDFNNDGKKDLIFNGEIDGEKKPCSFVSSGRWYNYSNLQKKSNSTTVYSVDTTTVNKEILLIIITTGYEPNYKNNSVASLKSYTDTLMHMYEGFIGFKNSQRKLFHYDSLMVTISSFYLKAFSSQIPEQLSIKILKDGRAVFSESRFDVNSGANLILTYQFEMNEKQMEIINKMVALIVQTKRIENYSVESYHVSSADLKIYFFNRIKKIRDHGLLGTYELKQFYKTLFKIIKDQREKISHTTSINNYWHYILE
ncbi:MAG: hypothetical protein V4722_14660 [Bacteroidota bacterium]